MPIEPTFKSPIRYGFLLMPYYSMMAVTSAIEPLRMANQLSKNLLFDWPVITLDGNPVAASNGLIMNPTHSIENAPPLEILFVCSGLNVNNVFNKTLGNLLRKLASQNKKIGSLCTGSYLLAKAGILDGYRCTVHWEVMASLRENYPRVIVSDELYEMDRDRITCCGGSASFDLMLKLISLSDRNILTSNIPEQFMWGRVRGKNDRQRIPLQLQLGAFQSKLTEAVTLMENNIEEPINLEELSKYVGVSRRQLERLFRKHLKCVPTRYYMNLRLNRARELLLQTSKSIIEVAIACGFVSAPHFSKCYRDYFGKSPRDDRQSQQ